MALHTSLVQAYNQGSHSFTDKKIQDFPAP